MDAPRSQLRKVYARPQKDVCQAPRCVDDVALKKPDIVLRTEAFATRAIDQRRCVTRSGSLAKARRDTG